MDKKNLAIDIGNTNVNCGLFCNGKLEKTFKFNTDRIEKTNVNFFKQINAFGKNKINNTIVCSVVPDVTPKIKKIITDNLFCNLTVVGEDLIVPIKNLYDKPKEVGQDRLINAFAVKKLYRYPAIVIDFGTAITFDIINASGEYEGGIIFPGLDISLNALIKHTSLLPNIEIKKPLNFVGKNTISSMQSGIYYGYGYFVKAMVNKLKKDVSKKNKVVIGTGGDISVLKPILKETINIFDVNLTLKGLNLLSSNCKR